MKCNFNKFESLITVQANKPDNETLEKHDLFEEYRNLSGYTYISNPRLKSKGGGVGLYIKGKLVFFLNSDLTIMNQKYFELFSLLYSLKTSQSFVERFIDPFEMINSLLIFLIIIFFRL